MHMGVNKRRRSNLSMFICTGAGEERTIGKCSENEGERSVMGGPRNPCPGLREFGGNVGKLKVNMDCRTSIHKWSIGCIAAICRLGVIKTEV